jgi:hypothetical protein
MPALPNAIQHFPPHRTQAQLPHPLFDVSKVKLIFLRPQDGGNVAGVFGLSVQAWNRRKIRGKQKIP